MAREDEARSLMSQIEREPGWHAVVRFNGWTGEWSVSAWEGEREEDQENSYRLRYRGEWYRLRAALIEERSGGDGQQR